MNNPNDFVIKNGVLKKYKGKNADVVIPEGVTAIGESAFDGCKSLKEIDLPAQIDVKNIGKNAFAGCGGLALRIEDKKQRTEFLKKHGFPPRL